MKSLFDDFAYGLRLLIRNYGFSSLAILIMALGIGAISAIFSVTNAVLLRPLPYAHPERIVMIWGLNPKLDIAFKFPSSPGQFTDYLNQSDVFDHLVALLSNLIPVLRATRIDPLVTLRCE
ncbi:MAG: hypothetical protein J2P41_06040 [Blastocatellia bacterium]|nr:hypothetical protein [Blastocatellia bacterium]